MNLFAYPAYQAFADLMLPLSTRCRAGQSCARRVAGDRRHAARPLAARVMRSDRRSPGSRTGGRRSRSIRSRWTASPSQIVEEVAAHTPFCSLLHFRKDTARSPAQPRVLVIAPMSGHFATLLRGTVRTMLADHDVYITDWHNPRDVPLVAGPFRL